MTKRYPEFPSDWHQEAYIAGLKRELEGTRVRGDEVYEQNVLGELKRLGVSEPDAEPKKRGRPPKVQEPDPEPEPAAKVSSSR